MRGLALCSLFATAVLGHRFYLEKIPFIDIVPKVTENVAFGHVNRAGIGAKTDFGLDFSQRGHEWTQGWN